MTKEEMNAKIAELEKKHTKDKNAILKEYAYANNPYKIGAILEDHFHIIEVKSIDVHLSWGSSECFYKGVELKKDLTPTKKQINTEMYRNNVKRKLN